MNTLLQKRIGGMRTIFPLVMLAVPGAAHAQAADAVVPSALAQWNEQIVAAVADTALVQLAGQLSPAALIQTSEETAAGDTPESPSPATLPPAEFGAPADAAADAADDSMAGAPVALADQADAMFGAAPVSENELAETKGRQLDNWLAAVTNNTSTVRNNSVGDNSTTGNVNVSDSAFQNVTGISMVNFNTGNNSSINAAMSVNLQINYAAPGQ